MAKEKTRDEIAHRIENLLQKHAGVIRNLISEGHTFLEAMRSERAKYWIDEINNTAQALEPRETKQSEKIALEDIPF